MIDADTVADLVVEMYEIHEVVIAETGGLPGLRDGAMLHAAVARPFASFGGEDLYPDDFTKAAALFHSLIKSHPFMDGTKRTAFLAALYFLRKCGHQLPDRLPKDDVIRFCVAVAEENALRGVQPEIRPATVADIATWLRDLLAGNGENVAEEADQQ